MSKPTCDMKRDCPNPVTHIGERGFVYCAEHAPARKGWERCRQMRPWELKLIESGTPLPSYEPITLHEYRVRACPGWATSAEGTNNAHAALVQALENIVAFFDTYVTTLPDRNGKEMLNIDFSLDDARAALDLAQAQGE
jgi:hypothetical protein